MSREVTDQEKDLCHTCNKGLEPRIYKAFLQNNKKYHCCYGQNADAFPPNSYLEILMPNMTVLGGGAFRQ